MIISQAYVIGLTISECSCFLIVMYLLSLNPLSVINLLLVFWIGMIVSHAYVIGLTISE